MENYNSMKSLSGFTLLEVLIALAIIAIAISALLQSSSRDVDNSTYLKNKTIANRLILNTANKIQVGLVSAPYPPYEHVETVEMAHHKWFVIAKRYQYTSRLDRITIEVRETRESKAIEQLTLLRRKL